MTASSAPAASGGTEALESPFPPAPVEELLRLFIKAGRAHQLYLPNNPIYKGALDALRAGFSGIWAQTDELTLTFTETAICWFDHVVLSEPSKSGDSLSWMFFKDGVRELKLLKGFEDKEVVALLSEAGIGQSTCIGIGGDPIIGSTFSDYLKLFETDPQTKAVVMCGEIGGSDEEDAAVGA